MPRDRSSSTVVETWPPMTAFDDRGRDRRKETRGEKFALEFIERRARLHSRETHVVYHALRSFEGPLKRASRPLWNSSTTIEKEFISRFQSLEGVFVKGDTFIFYFDEIGVSRRALINDLGFEMKFARDTRSRFAIDSGPMKSTDARRLSRP